MIKVNIWYPQNTALDSGVSWMWAEAHRWGHAGVKFKSVPGKADAYFSFWPSQSSDWSQPVRGRVRRGRPFDIGAEGSPADNIIALHPGLDEAAAYDYWLALERSHSLYHYSGLNCCEAVARSIQAGLPDLQHHPSTCLRALPLVCEAVSSPRQLGGWLRLYVNPRLANLAPRRPTMRGPSPARSQR